MKMIRVRYKGPTETKSGRLIADDGDCSRYERSLNSIENELEERGEINSYAACCWVIAHEYMKKRWYHVDAKDIVLYPGHHGTDDYFVAIQGFELVEKKK